MSRTRATMSVPALEGLATTPDAREEQLVEQSAERAGFRTRHANGKPLPAAVPAPSIAGDLCDQEIDARSLGRPKGPRKNLNISVTPSLHRRFWLWGQQRGIHGGYNILEQLLDEVEKEAD